MERGCCRSGLKTSPANYSKTFVPPSPFPPTFFTLPHSSCLVRRSPTRLPLDPDSPTCRVPSPCSFLLPDLFTSLHAEKSPRLVEERHGLLRDTQTNGSELRGEGGGEGAGGGRGQGGPAGLGPPPMVQHLAGGRGALPNTPLAPVAALCRTSSPRGATPTPGAIAGHCQCTHAYTHRSTHK